MSNPYGRNEEKGPTLTLADLFGKSKLPPRPPCEHCDNGNKMASDIKVGRDHGTAEVCPKCGRLLCDYI